MAGVEVRRLREGRRRKEEQKKEKLEREAKDWEGMEWGEEVGERNRRKEAEGGRRESVWEEARRDGVRVVGAKLGEKRKESRRDAGGGRSRSEV